MTFHMYGLLIGVAVVVAMLCAEHILKYEKWKRELAHFDWGVFGCVVAGLIGARVYHLATDWSQYYGQPWWSFFALWRGGLGIYGGIIGGALGIFLWRKFLPSQHSLLAWLDVGAIVLPLAQALGRWGNYFNHELYGKPTNLPWAIAIPSSSRLPGYEAITHYHPLFLYESLALFTTFLVLWWLWRLTRENSVVKKTFGLGSGTFVALYLLAYGLTRFGLEFLRLVSAPGMWGLTVAQWWSMLAIILGILLLARQSARLFFAPLAAFVGVLFFAFPVRAQTPAFDLSVSPSVVEVALQPGKLVTQAIQIENQGQLDLVVTPKVRDFISDQKTGLPVLQKDHTFPYISLHNSDYQLDTPFTLAAGQSVQLVVALDPPEDAPNKDWYFTLLLESKPDQRNSLAELSAQTSGTIGANFLVSIKPTDEPERDWQLALNRVPKIMDSLQSITFDVIANNRSAHVGTPDVSVLVLRGHTQVVHEMVGLPERVLAQSSRRLQAAEPDPQDPRSQRGTVFRFDPFFAWGPYTIRATVRNGLKGPVVVEKVVWALPLSLLGGLFFAIAMLFFARLLRKRMRHKHERKEEDS